MNRNYLLRHIIDFKFQFNFDILKIYFLFKSLNRELELFFLSFLCIQMTYLMLKFQFCCFIYSWTEYVRLWKTILTKTIQIWKLKKCKNQLYILIPPIFFFQGDIQHVSTGGISSNGNKFKKYILPPEFKEVIREPPL